MVRARYEDVLSMPEARQQLDPAVRFYFGDQPTPPVLATFGSDQSNRPTFRPTRGDEPGCRWAALAALVALQAKAKYLGANAVTQVVSYSKEGSLSSRTEFECRVTPFTVNAGFKATYAKVAE